MYDKNMHGERIKLVRQWSLGVHTQSRFD